MGEHILHRRIQFWRWVYARAHAVARFSARRSWHITRTAQLRYGVTEEDVFPF